MTVTPVVAVNSPLDSTCDVVIFINDGIEHLQSSLRPVEAALDSFRGVNPKLQDELSVVPFPNSPCGRLVYSPTGQLNTDVADIRNVYDAAVIGVKRAVSMGFKNPLLCCGPLSTAPSDLPWAQRDNLQLNAILGALHALYTPLEVREMRPNKFPKANQLGVFEASNQLIKIACAIEEGRTIARDIGGSDPERMAAPRIEEYLGAHMADLAGIQMTVEKVNQSKYPLMAAVNRAASTVPRHDGRVIHISYTPPNPGQIDTTLFLVGKGITYDTGGADVKAGGVMAGMHRDKCGAAALAGFMKTLGILQPPGLAVSASLAFVRNSIGSNAYVADEIIVSRAGERVRVGNTDAEGRMVMTDLLCEAKEKALKSKNPFLFTVATLTGHVIRAYKDYMAIMDNGPARKKNVSVDLQQAGDLLSDLAEISTIRKEDFDFNKGKSEYDDILQCNNLPSSATPRGHQIPAAFMIMASGLYKHGLDSQTPIPYTHVDVAGSAAEIHVMPTASPLMMFASRYVLPRIKSLP